MKKEHIIDWQNLNGRGVEYGNCKDLIAIINGGGLVSINKDGLRVDPRDPNGTPYVVIYVMTMNIDNLFKSNMTIRELYVGKECVYSDLNPDKGMIDLAKIVNVSKNDMCAIHNAAQEILNDIENSIGSTP